MIKTSEVPSIAVIIVNYRTPALTLEALAALADARQHCPTLQAFVVDGGSADNSAELLRTGIAEAGLSDWVRLLALPINGGFGWANNQAMLELLQSNTPPDYIHLLNPDARVEPGAIERLADVLSQHPECAVVGSLLLNEDGTPSGSAFRFPTAARELERGARTGILGRVLGIKPVAIEHCPAQTVDWVTGASMMIRGAALREVGLFDSGFFLYFEEIELMARLNRAGWTVQHEPASRVRHIGGASTGMTYRFSDFNVAPPLPAYWFRSRRRLFTRLHGRGRAIAAGLAWLAGHTAFMTRRMLHAGGGHVLTRREARDLMRYGLVPDRHDRLSAITLWQDAPGAPPAWMAWAEESC